MSCVEPAEVCAGLRKLSRMKEHEREKGHIEGTPTSFPFLFAFFNSGLLSPQIFLTTKRYECCKKIACTHSTVFVRRAKPTNVPG